MNRVQMIRQQVVLDKEFTVYGTWEKPLFLAKDVAEWIEYDTEQVGKMLKTVDDDEKLTVTFLRSGQNREAWFLTEDGLYEVLMQSRKPIAKDWKKAVKQILKEVRMTGTYINPNYSPQLQLLINLEMEQQRQAQELQQTNHRLDNICDVLSLNSRTWRKDSKTIIHKIAEKSGGTGKIKEVYQDIYALVEHRAGVNLGVRQKNKIKRMAESGMSKSQQDKFSKLDVIEEDKKCIEIYLAVVKDMAIAKGVTDFV